MELGAGGLIQADLVPKAIATATGAAGDFDLFAELVIQRGTERNRVELDAAGRLAVTSRDARADEWFPAATIGALYFAAEPGIVLAAQYYYNPLGYPDSAALAPARDALGAPAGGGPPRTGPRPEVVDLLFFGRHYAGASAAWNGIADSDLRHLRVLAGQSQRRLRHRAARADLAGAGVRPALRSAPVSATAPPPRSTASASPSPWAPPWASEASDGRRPADEPWHLQPLCEHLAPEAVVGRAAVACRCHGAPVCVILVDTKYGENTAHLLRHDRVSGRRLSRDRQPLYLEQVVAPSLCGSL